MNDKIHQVNYFMYKGVAYGVGTKVLFSDKIHKKLGWNARTPSKSERQSQYSMDTYELCERNRLILRTSPQTFQKGLSDGCLYFNIGLEYVAIDNPDEDIAEIVEPVYAELVSWKKQAVDNIVNKNVHPDIFNGVLMYIIIMLVGTIFNARFIIWIAATIIFVAWLLNEYRT